MTSDNVADGVPVAQGSGGWEQRAIAAEARANELHAKLGTTTEELAEARATLSGATRRHELEVELIRANAIDLEAARLLAEATIAVMTKPDARQAVADLKSGKPFLFRTRTVPPSGMSPIARMDKDDLADVAEQARATGDRRTLMKYLRAKRRDSGTRP